jgi:hypothetical protein
MHITQCERTIRSYTQRIDASPAEVFPLLCPVREAEWLEGFHSDMIFSESGVAEDGCVFRTQIPGDPETIWMIVHHDRQEGLVEFVRVTTGLVATRLRILVAGNGDDTTSVHVTYTFTPISEEGAAFVRNNHEEAAFRKSMEWWEKSMNHFIKTGRMLRKSQQVS